MGLFGGYPYHDVLLLTPVRKGKEQLPKNKVRMLFCDPKGKVQTALMDKSLYETARRRNRGMQRVHKDYATLGISVNPDEYAPLTVEVGTEEVWALELILKHALRNGKTPDVLKKYPKQIIMRGESKREQVIVKHEERNKRTQVTPDVLRRLPYYDDENTEISIPIYKAEHRYPLIALRRLPTSESDPAGIERLLIMDSDGDLAITRVPTELIERAEKGAAGVKTAKGEHVCIVLSKHGKNLIAGQLVISNGQKRALEVVTRYFEQTGHGRRPISSSAQSVLDSAQYRASALG